MITITVTNKQKPVNLINPVDMLNNKWERGQAFQQYFHGKPCSDYYISCGINEKSVIHIWHWDEEHEWRISSDNLVSLMDLNTEVQVAAIDAEIKIEVVI